MMATIQGLSGHIGKRVYRRKAGIPLNINLSII